MNKALIVATTVVLSLTAVIYFFLMRDPRAPAVVVISVCRDKSPGMQRISADFGMEFDISNDLFSVRKRALDMPATKFYIIQLQAPSDDGDVQTSGQYANGLIIAHDDGIWPDLRGTFPIYSRHTKEGNLGDKGNLVGSDRWGYLKNGERWRYVAFSNHDVIAYRPAPLSEALLMDKVISSACVTPSANGMR